MLYGHQEIFVFMLLLPVVCMILVPLAMLVIWSVKSLFVNFCASRKAKNTDTEFAIENLKTIH